MTSMTYNVFLAIMTKSFDQENPFGATLKRLLSNQLK